MVRGGLQTPLLLSGVQAQDIRTVIVCFVRLGYAFLGQVINVEERLEHIDKLGIDVGHGVYAFGMPCIPGIVKQLVCRYCWASGCRSVQ